MQIRSAALTDVGLHRGHNEDAYVARPEDGVFAVADGMGGHAAGEVASGIAIEILRSWPVPAGNAAESLGATILEANRRILEHARQHPECAGMGTTMTALLVDGSNAVAAHVGDSRLYRLRAGQLTQLTDDHTWVQEQVKAGYLRPADAARHPLSSILTQALGTREEIQVDTLQVDLQTGDRLLLCTDGLSGMVPDAEIEQILSSGLTLQQSVQRLIDRANQAGGLDNITALLIEVS